MKKISLTINGKKVEVPSGQTIKDVLLKYFTDESEFVVKRNSSIIIFDFNRIPVEENDVIEVISYNKKIIAKSAQNGLKQKGKK